MSLSELVERWRDVPPKERANAQSYVIELCDALGVEKPRPSGSGYEFEYAVTVVHRDGTETVNHADLFKRDHFLLEAKDEGDQTEESPPGGAPRRAPRRPPRLALGPERCTMVITETGARGVREENMMLFRRSTLLWSVACLVAALVTAAPLRAQDRDEVPRTRTFPGIDSPGFPYAQPEEVGLSSEELNRLGDDIVSWVSDGALIGAELLVVKDEKAVFHEAYGWSDREAERPMRRNSVFWVGSMTKPVTATAALILIEQGRLSLDDRVSEYIPEIPNDSLRVRHLLAHTSGYAYWGDDYDSELDAHASLESLVNAYVARGPVRPFGEYTYSNFNYEALGYIVEKVTGVPAAAFTAEHVLAPLGLDDTYANFSPDTSSWALRVNALYQRGPETGGYEKIRWSADPEMGDPWNFYMPSSGLFSTAMDYARFMSVWLNKGQLDGVRLLPEAAVEDALRPHTRRGAQGRDPYGFGWKVLVSPEHPTVDGMPPAFHHGGVAGTFAVAFPSVDALVVYMTHSRGGPHRARLKNRLVDLDIFDHPGPHLAAGLVPISEVDVFELTPEEQRRYVGSYRSEDPEEQREIVHEVFVEDGRLRLRLWSPRSDEGDLVDLVPIGEHRFGTGRYHDGQLEALGFEQEVRFIVEGGRARGFDVLAGDRVIFSAQRIE